jgi:3-oxoacyl-[acyl-carrier protein] reductase
VSAVAERWRWRPTARSTTPCAATAQTIADQLGPADILAAFAGSRGLPVASAEETAEHWRAGVIVTMSSAAARQPARSNAAYAAAKAGVIALTRHLAAELGPQGIRVNCLAPSAIENEPCGRR